MECQELHIEKNHVYKLLCAASPDAALLYLYVQSGNEPDAAAAELKLSQSRYACAAATLRQLGLWPEKKQNLIVGERPRYTERDVLGAMETDVDFRRLYDEVQRLLGKTLTTEELKILLSFIRYLGMPMDVISVLVCYCKDKARQKGGRNPSLRAIEKEAYAWAEQGIDTMEEAVAFIQNQNMRQSQLGKLMQILQIRGRSLTPGEERYAQKWLDMGFAGEVIALAYERTCLNIGGLNWAYMNKILLSWHEAGLHTLEQVKNGETKKKSVPKGASGQLGDAEMEAIQKLLQGG